MTSTTTLTQRVTGLESDLSGIRGDIAELKGLLVANLSPEAPAKASRGQVTIVHSQRGRASVRKPKGKVSPSKVALCDKKGLTRKEFNGSVSKLTRAMGQHASGISVYRFVQDRYPVVREARAAGKTARQAVALVLKSA